MQQWRQVSSIYWKAQGREKSTSYERVLYAERDKTRKIWRGPKKKKLQDTFGARDIRSPCALNRLSQSEREGFESRFDSERKEFRQCKRGPAGDVLVVIVFSSKDIDVHSNACVHREGVQDMGKHFR